MASNNSLTAAFESLPKIAKLLIVILGGAIVGGIYRIVRFFETKNTITLVAGLLGTFTVIGNVVAWILDIYGELVNDKITYFAD